MSQCSLLQIDPAVAGHIPELDLDPAAEQVAAFRRAGVGVVRRMIRDEEVTTLRDAFMDATADGPIEGLSEMQAKLPGAADDPLKRYPRMLQQHRRGDLEIGRLSLRYMLDARMAGVLRAVIREEPIAAQSMFYFKPPGSRGQGLHQDNRSLAVRPSTCFAAWMALDRCDAQSGALSLVPGSGPLDLLCDAPTEDRADIFFTRNSIKLPEGVEPVTAEMDPGDVLFFNGQLIHGSYPNETTDRWRRTLIFHYVPQSCEEVAVSYHPLIGFDGRVVERRISPTGGLCGEFHEQPASTGLVLK